VNSRPSERSNASVNARPHERTSAPQQNPAVMELRAVRQELEGVRDELIGLRADLKDRKTFGIANQIVQGLFLTGLTWFGIVVVFGILVTILGRR